MTLIYNGVSRIKKIKNPVDHILPILLFIAVYGLSTLAVCVVMTLTQIGEGVK